MAPKAFVVERFVWRVFVPLVFSLCIVLTIGAAFDRDRVLAPDGLTTDALSARSCTSLRAMETSSS